MDHRKTTKKKTIGFWEWSLTLRVGEDIPVAEALAVLQVRALDLEAEAEITLRGQ